MTLAEAIAAIEGAFTVHEEQGLPLDYEDQNGASRGAGPRDMTLAPNGEPYATVTSYGVNAELPEDVPAMFAAQGPAVEWWYDEVMAWRGRVVGDDDPEPQVHLFWRSRPAFFSTTYLAMDQGGLLRTASPLASVLQIDLGFVASELLVTRVGPNEKEG